ncbi:MAG: GntR family transcriptional regulator [Lachnospiraceae bacterium]|nr:GntR family transcriptional regulator [Lachnospiraceae bacterium]
MIVLDYRDKRPIYEQVVEKLEHLIVCGALEANTKMPSVRSLALDLSVNPNTIQRAYAQLEQDGYLYTVVGRGNYVTSEQEWKSGKIEQLMTEVREALTKAHDIGVPKEDIWNAVSEIYAETTP